MILIPPEFDRRGGGGADASGLITSIRHALAAEAPFDTTNLWFRVLGTGVVIEGMVSAPDGDEFIRQVAEAIAGSNRVLVRVGCPRYRQ